MPVMSTQAERLTNLVKQAEDQLIKEVPTCSRKQS
jgi:hypothetical protein